MDNLKKLRILIAEDDEESLLLLKKYLSDYGVCDGVCDGEAAYNLFLQALSDDFAYDLITLDLTMPKMSGHEVLHKIREQQEQIGIELKSCESPTIIITTAAIGAKPFIKAMKYNCDAYIEKPVRKEFIKNKLKELNLID